MPEAQYTSAVIIEPDEVLPKTNDICQDASVIQMAQELLALSGKGPLPTLTQFRPLHRPRTFTASKSNVSFAIGEKKTKRDYLAAISDDEDDCRWTKRARREMTVPLQRIGGDPSSMIPLGRPLACPPRLPCLPPGMALPPAMMNKSSLK